MSGLFGVFDPEGTDPAQLESAASLAAYRGEPTVMVEGPVAMGVFSRPGASVGCLASGTSFLVADARVDGPLPGSAAATLRESGIPLLDSVMGALGPKGLEGVAADYALARYDAKRREVLLARSVGNLRPLYWARSGPRFGFASDPAILRALGLASGLLDPDVIRAWMWNLRTREETAFVGIRRLMGGWWARFALDGRASTGRWFYPERVAENPTTLEEAADLARSAILEAVRCRVQGERVALSLSSGVDSGSIAVALGLLGVRSTCLTYHFDAEDVVHEGPSARELAEVNEHEWREMPVSRHITAQQVTEMPLVTGTPLGLPVPPSFFALRDAVVDAHATVLADGEGADGLFAAPPIAVLDLLRKGRLSLAMRTGRGLNRSANRRYAITGKGIVRALAPPSLMERRDARRVAPWLMPLPEGIIERPCTGQRDWLLRWLAEADCHIFEVTERVMQTRGVSYVAPFLDLRVIRCALGLPIELRVPTPEPKPVLARALLKADARSRAKVPWTGYYRALAQATRQDFPDWFSGGSMAAKRGYIRGEGLAAMREPVWLGNFLRLFPVEAWLRTQEEDHGDS